MAKKKRKVIGSIVKGKDGKGDYIKILNDVELKAGSFINLESKAMKQKQLDTSVAEGKLTGDLVEKIQAGIDKMPEWVRFELYTLEESQ